MPLGRGLLLALALAAPLPATAGAAAAVAAPWAPDVQAANVYADSRAGEVAFSVRTATRAWHRDGDGEFAAASVLKAMLLVAYLDRPGVRSHALEAGQRALPAPMIRRSANVPANSIMGIVGERGLRRVARAAGMTRFSPVPGVWGLSRITARDGSRLMLRIDALLPARHRAYAMALLETIAASQRWGIGEVSPPGWRLFFKGGWGDGSGVVDHQIALLTRGEQRVSVAILTRDNASHADGKRTLRGVAQRLLAGLSQVDQVD